MPKTTMFLPLLLLLLLQVMPFPTFAGSIPPTFEQKLGSGKSSEFRLLGLLSYPDRTILLSDHSFSNKTALIEEVAAFADKESNLEPLKTQMTTKWTEAGGQAEQMTNLMSSIQTVVDQARLRGVEKIRATMLALFALGEDLLDQMLVNKEELNGDADEKFALGLKENLTKVQRALSGQDQNELMEVLDTELMDQTAGIGSKIDDKYADAMNDGQTVSLDPMLAGKPEAVKMVAQLVSHSVDKRLSEVAGVDGAWGFVKEDGGDGDAGNEVVAEGEEEGEEEDDGMEIGEDDEKDGQEEEEHEDAKLDKDETKEATGKDAKAAMAPVKLEESKKQEPMAVAAVA